MTRKISFDLYGEMTVIDTTTQPNEDGVMVEVQTVRIVQASQLDKHLNMFIESMTTEQIEQASKIVSKFKGVL